MKNLRLLVLFIFVGLGVVAQEVPAIDVLSSEEKSEVLAFNSPDNSYGPVTKIFLVGPGEEVKEIAIDSNQSPDEIAESLLLDSRNNDEVPFSAAVSFSMTPLPPTIQIMGAAARHTINVSWSVTSLDPCGVYGDINVSFSDSWNSSASFSPSNIYEFTEGYESGSFSTQASWISPGGSNVIANLSYQPLDTSTGPNCGTVFSVSVSRKTDIIP